MVLVTVTETYATKVEDYDRTWYEEWLSILQLREPRPREGKEPTGCHLSSWWQKKVCQPVSTKSYDCLTVQPGLLVTLKQNKVARYFSEPSASAYPCCQYSDELWVGSITTPLYRIGH